MLMTQNPTELMKK